MIYFVQSNNCIIMRRLLLSSSSTFNFYSTSSQIRVLKSTAVNTSSYNSAYLLLKEFQYIKSRLPTRPTAANEPTDQPLKSIITTTTSTFTRAAKISKDTFDFDRIDVKLYNSPCILNSRNPFLFINFCSAHQS